ncbi:SET domain-containing protein [Trematosphaeria pertusa]|uniref:SET domain-containing protein n=1 Tax=Trematosphaeria pertusa TaxID=390896 RepID=A0A6A6IRP8_9PLEO|nr:SET domain-containing protein [Trematosphaeria pertusa]KAF2252989.1 SET domain-containing protein [Trematosphaeria pertusa]
MALEAPQPGATSLPFYLAPSEACVNEKGERIGKGIIAGTDFKGGELIAALKRPLVGSLDTERLKDTCANCYVWTEGSSLGSRLYRFRYCSKACQKEAWNRGHKHECKNLKPVSDKEIPKAVLACMDVLVRRKHGLILDRDWEMLCELDTHIDDFKRNGKYGGIELMALGTSQFSFTQDTFSKDFVAGMYARILSNSLTLVTPTYDPLGIMIDPVLSYLNHSCDPNAYVVMDGPGVELRALKDIKKDEEIYISYIDTTIPYARRQTELKERWFFTCRCSKCRKGPSQQEDKWAIDPRDLADKWKEVADDMIKGAESASDPANYVGSSIDEKRVAALQGEAFRVYEQEQRACDPAEAIATIEDGMRLCFQSGLWPVYRQPYAAFRDDLIVNMLAAGNYDLAWVQCAKRNRHIIPKLYSQVHHPIRVVQTWQMAMLAQYLASEGREIAPGVDMAVIAAMLIHFVATTSKTSHGPNSAFSRSVQKKYEEVEAELVSKFGSKDGADATVKRQAHLLMEMGDWVQV